MGVGIAQVAALAGHTVRLFDSREGAAAAVAGQLAATLDEPGPGPHGSSHRYKWHDQEQAKPERGQWLSLGIHQA